MSDNKIRLITIVENISDNEQAVFHEGYVNGTLEDAYKALKKAFYDRLQYYLNDWGVADDYAPSEYFTINETDYEYNATSEDDHIQAYIETIDEIKIN